MVNRKIIIFKPMNVLEYSNTRKLNQETHSFVYKVSVLHPRGILTTLLSSTSLFTFLQETAVHFLGRMMVPAFVPRSI